MAQEMESVKTVEVKVKVPPGYLESGLEELSLGTLPVSTKIGELRRLIQRDLSTHPLPERQRLLYAGRALVDNEVTISDAFNVVRDPTQRQYFVHLLVRAEGMNNGPIGLNRQHAASPAQGARVAPPNGTPHVQAPNVPPTIPVQHQQHLHNVSGLQNPRGDGFVVHHSVGPNVQHYQIHHQQTVHHIPQQIPAPATNPATFRPSEGLTGRDRRLPAVSLAHQQVRQNLDSMGHTLNQLEEHLLDAAELDELGAEIQRGNITQMEAAVQRMRVAREADANRVMELDNGLRQVYRYIEVAQHAAHQAGVPLQAPNPPHPPPQPPAHAAAHLAHLAHFHPGMNALPRMPFMPLPFQMPLPAPLAPQTHTQPAPATCYLLSSPNGPHAVLFDPTHGNFSTQPAPTATTPVTSATTATSNNADEQNRLQVQRAEPAGAVAAPAQGQAPAAQAAAAQDDALGPLQPLLGHFWLLFRVLIFAWFVMGGSLGWRRPLAILVIGVGFWFIRLGLFGQNGVARRWWDDIMAVPRRGGPANQAQAPNEAQEPRQPGQMPEPADVAARLINQHRNAQWGPAREVWMQVQRVLALLLASLWPGIGEAHVRAREEEERRQQEEEVAARRREEEQRRQQEEAAADASKEKAAQDKAQPVNVEQTEKDGVTSGPVPETSSPGQADAETKKTQ